MKATSQVSFAQKKKGVVKWLSSMKQIQFNVDREGGDGVQKQKRVVVVKQPITDKEQPYVWQDFLTVYNLREDQVQKLNQLLPKGVTFIKKDLIPQTMKYTLTHSARKMNLAKQYDKKQAEQALKYQVEETPIDENKWYQQPEQSNASKKSLANSIVDNPTVTQKEVTLSESQINQKESSIDDKSEENEPKKDQPIFISHRGRTTRKYMNANWNRELKIQFSQQLPKSQDMSVYLHPAYDDLKNAVVIRQMIDPQIYKANKKKSIQKEFKVFQKERLLQERKEKLKMAKLNYGLTKKHQIQIKRQMVLKQKKLKQSKLNSKQVKKVKAKLTVMENPRIALQLEAIRELMNKVQSHQLYPVLLQAKTYPSMHFLFKVLQAKIKKYYKITQFESDIQRIFKVFVKRSKQKAQALRNMKNYQNAIQAAINQKKIQFPNQEEKPNLPVEKQSTVPETKGRKRKNPVKKTETKNPQNWKQQFRKQRAKNNYNANEIQRLGKNIFTLNQKNLQHFCINFCEPESQRNQGAVFGFDFDLNNQTQERLTEMQIFLKEKLEQQKKSYLDLTDNDFLEPFVIQNDD